MNNAFDEQTAVAAEEPKTDENNASAPAVSFGKFKDANALLDAYNSLEAEFTKRCQRLKELESALSDDKAKTPEGKEETKSISDEDKENILKDYLKSVLGAKQTAIVMDNAGAGVRTPADKPRSIAEAGSLAKSLF